MACFIICYDIANPKRLVCVHRSTVKYARFVQYSVYYLEGKKQQLDALLENIAGIINPAEDDVRAYSVTPLRDAICLGQSWVPDDIFLV